MQFLKKVASYLKRKKKENIFITSFTQVKRVFLLLQNISLDMHFSQILLIISLLINFQVQSSPKLILSFVYLIDSFLIFVDLFKVPNSSLICLLFHQILPLFLNFKVIYICGLFKYSQRQLILFRKLVELFKMVQIFILFSC